MLPYKSGRSWGCLNNYYGKEEKQNLKLGIAEAQCEFDEDKYTSNKLYTYDHWALDGQTYQKMCLLITHRHLEEFVINKSYQY